VLDGRGRRRKRDGVVIRPSAVGVRLGARWAVVWEAVEGDLFQRDRLPAMRGRGRRPVSGAPLEVLVLRASASCHSSVSTSSSSGAEV
jgi:hypothetical protein